MKWKISNTLFVLAVVLFIVGVLFNWEQAKTSVNDSLAKARKVKADIAKKKKESEPEKDNTTSSTNGVIKKDGEVLLEEIEIIKSKI